MVIGPVYSERRSCSAVRAAASPPPTMTMPPLLLIPRRPLAPVPARSSPRSSLAIAFGSSCAVLTRSLDRCDRHPVVGLLAPHSVNDVGEHHDAFAALDV